MSEEEIGFLPYAEASALVKAIQEEEDIQEVNHRIFTVYSQDNRELCWFDFDEIMRDVNPPKGDDGKQMVTEYILNHIPDWVLDS